MPCHVSVGPKMVVLGLAGSLQACCAFAEGAGCARLRGKHVMAWWPAVLTFHWRLKSLLMVSTMPPTGPGDVETEQLFTVPQGKLHWHSKWRTCTARTGIEEQAGPAAHSPHSLKETPESKVQTLGVIVLTSFGIVDAGVCAADARIHTHRGRPHYPHGVRLTR